MLSRAPPYNPEPVFSKPAAVWRKAWRFGWISCFMFRFGLGRIGTGSGLSSSNLTQRVKDLGFQTDVKVKKTYDVNPAFFGQTNNFITSADNFGTQYQRFNGIDFNANARMRNGLIFQGGTSTGRTITDRCETVVKIDNPSPRNCRTVQPFQTQFRGSASYTLPKVDVLVSAIVRSQPEVQLSGATVLTGNTSAQWQVPNSVIAAALGHLPPGATATGNTTIQLADNEHRIYSNERRTQIDVRFAKIVRYGRTRADVGVDLNNLLNTNYATGFATTYIYNTDNTPRPSGWGTPASIYTPRFVRLNFTVNF